MFVRWPTRPKQLVRAPLSQVAEARRLCDALLGIFDRDICNVRMQSPSPCDNEWVVIAAIGTVESSNGTSTRRGSHTGANAVGPRGDQLEPASIAH